MEKGIGFTIKQLRELLNISQKELATDICTQSYISKVEKDQVIPSAELLYQIAIRLGVEIDYFFENKKNSREEYAREFCEIIKEYKLHFKYDEIYYMVKNEKNNPFFRTIYMQKFLLWHEGVSLYYMKQSLEVPLLLLNKALELGVHNIETIKANLEILNSIASLYNDEAKKYYLNEAHNAFESYANKAKETYEQALAIFKHHKMLMDDDLYIKILNNYSKLLHRTERYMEALEICERGIRKNLKTNNLFHLGNLFHQKGLAYQQLEEYMDSIKCFEKAKMVFDIQNSQELKDYCELSIKVSKLFEKGIKEYEGKSLVNLESEVIESLYMQMIME